MKVSDFDESLVGGRVRLSARVDIDRSGQPWPQRLWIDWPEDYRPYLSLRADPFVVMLLPLAGTLGDGIECDTPISETLYHNLLEASGVYRSYFPDSYHDVALSLKTEARQRTERGLQASFFSGGVDALYNIAESERRHRAGLGRAVDHLWLVHGFDIKLADEQLWKAVGERLVGQWPHGAAPKIASVRTNIRRFYDGVFVWEKLGFSAAAGGVAKCASGSVDRVLFGSYTVYDKIIPVSSTPLVDPLWSCDEQSFVHFSCRVGRIEKLRMVGGAAPESLRNLRVCWENPEGVYNCGRCEKCLRTRLQLRLLGFEDLVDSFDGSFAPEAIRLLRLPDDAMHRYVVDYWRELLDACRENPAHADCARAIEHVLRESAVAGVATRIDKPGIVTPWQNVVTTLQELVVKTARSVIPDEGPLALLDFERSFNCGDAAIWSGQAAILRAMGRSPVYRCTVDDYDEDALRDALGDGTILLRGGGNFGDRYAYHAFHERIVAAFPDNAIVVFPKSVAFRKQAALDLSVDLFARHPNVTIMARDARSYSLLKRLFGTADVLFCPDAALALGVRRRPLEPTTDILWLARSDGESAIDRESLMRDVLGCTKTLTASYAWGSRDGAETMLRIDAGPGIEVTDWYRMAWRRAADAAAFSQLDHDTAANLLTGMALAILARGRVVVTDRLHGHILCLMMGIPHVVLDNNIGKLGDFFHSWTHNADIVHWADTPHDALDIARGLVDKAG